jgi:hypothetical protein
MTFPPCSPPRGRASASPRCRGPIAAAALESVRLASVLDPFAPSVPGVFLHYPARRQVMPKLRAFIDHMKRGNALQPG